MNKTISEISPTNNTSFFTWNDTGHLVATVDSQHECVHLWKRQDWSYLGSSVESGVCVRWCRFAPTMTSSTITTHNVMVTISGTDCCVTLWTVDETETLARITTLVAPCVDQDVVGMCAFSSDGSLMITGSRYGALCVWDMKNYTLIDKPIAAHGGYAICDCAFRTTPALLPSSPSHNQNGGSDKSKDTYLVVTAGLDGTLKLWNVNRKSQCVFKVKQNQSSPPPPPPPTTTTTHTITPSLGVEAGIDLNSVVRNVTTLGSKDSEDPSADPEVKTNADAEKETEAEAEAEKENDYCYESIYIDTDAYSVFPNGLPMTGHIGGVLSCAFRYDGNVIVSTSDDHTVRLWCVLTHRQIGEPMLVPETFVPTACAFSPAYTKGQYVAAYAQGNLWLWDAKTQFPLGCVENVGLAFPMTLFKTVVQHDDDDDDDDGKESFIFALHQVTTTGDPPKPKPAAAAAAAAATADAEAAEYKRQSNNGNGNGGKKSDGGSGTAGGGGAKPAKKTNNRAFFTTFVPPQSPSTSTTTGKNAVTVTSDVAHDGSAFSVTSLTKILSRLNIGNDATTPLRFGSVHRETSKDYLYNILHEKRQALLDLVYSSIMNDIGTIVHNHSARTAAIQINTGRYLSIIDLDGFKDVTKRIQRDYFSNCVCDWKYCKDAISTIHYS